MPELKDSSQDIKNKAKRKWELFYKSRWNFETISEDILATKASSRKITVGPSYNFTTDPIIGIFSIGGRHKPLSEGRQWTYNKRSVQIGPGRKLENIRDRIVSIEPRKGKAIILTGRAVQSPTYPSFRLWLQPSPAFIVEKVVKLLEKNNKDITTSHSPSENFCPSSGLLNMIRKNRQHLDEDAEQTLYALGQFHIDSGHVNCRLDFGQIVVEEVESLFDGLAMRASVIGESIKITKYPKKKEFTEEIFFELIECLDLNPYSAGVPLVRLYEELVNSMPLVRSWGSIAYVDSEIKLLLNNNAFTNSDISESEES